MYMWYKLLSKTLSNQKFLIKKRNHQKVLLYYVSIYYVLNIITTTAELYTQSRFVLLLN